MKTSCLFIATSFLFLLLVSCENAAQIAAISAHTWAVTADSPNGAEGDEYVFYDNRLFFHTTNGITIDGQWDFDQDNATIINIITDTAIDSYLYTVNGKSLTLTLVGGTVSAEYRLQAKE